MEAWRSGKINGKSSGSRFREGSPDIWIFIGGPMRTCTASTPSSLRPFLLEIDDIGIGRMPINPVPMMVPLDAERGSLATVSSGSTFPEWKCTDDPGLALGVDDDALAGVRQDAPAALLVEHAVVVGAIGHDVALVAGDDRLAQVGAAQVFLYCKPLLPAGLTLTCTRSSKFLTAPPRQVMKRLYLSVPSAVPVRHPSSTFQYLGLPSQPVRSLPLKIAVKPSGSFARGIVTQDLDREDRHESQRTQG